MRSWLFAVAPALSLLAFMMIAAPRAHAQADGSDPALAQAKAHFEAGRTAYLGGDYASAVREFEAAEVLRPSPILDYNIGLAYEGLGDARRAIDSYNRYLTQKPDAQNRADVEARVATLRRSAAPQPQQQPYPNQPQYPQQGYDPYAGQQQGQYYPPPQPYTPPPVKRHSRWWIAPVVIGAVVVTVVLVVALAYATTPSTVYEKQSPLLSGGANGQPGIPPQAPALFRF